MLLVHEVYIHNDIICFSLDILLENNTDYSRFKLDILIFLSPLMVIKMSFDYISSDVLLNVI